MSEKQYRLCVTNKSQINDKLTGHLRLLYIDFQSVFDHHDFTHSKLKHHLASYYLNAAFDMLIDTVYVIDHSSLSYSFSHQYV